MKSSGKTIVPMLLIMLGFLHPANAANFTCPSGDVACLIAAINTANVNGQTNTITLAAGTYALTVVDNTTDGPNGLPSITSNLAVAGAGAASTSIRVSRSAFRVIHVAANGSLSLQGVTVQGGLLGLADGAGILNRGTLTIADSVVSGNESFFVCGGISNYGTLQIRRSRITGNVATYGGGGICTSGPTKITDSVIVGNRAADAAGNAGGIANGGNLVIERSTISSNRAEREAGGLANSGSLTVTNSAFVGNSAGGSIGGTGGGAIRNYGSVSITNSTFAGNATGGGGGSAILSGGGAISNSGVLRITNSTFSHNASATCGGAILSQIGSASSVVLQNTILALNQANPAVDPSLCGNITIGSGDCFGPVTSLDNNLIGDPTGCAITLGSKDLTGDPGLGTFSDNGTPGNGHFPLLSTSRAIDAANDAACPPTDQLGQPRAGHCDIGAIEFQPLKVMIDIKPGSDPPAVNPRSVGIITVAILTTSTFSAATVDASTVRFGKTGIEAAPVRSNYRNGTLDMILQFNTQGTGIRCGDTSASLTGKTLNKFPIWGADAIVTVGCR